jgi:PadR family transcriptional regulator, regulatory protein PadR
MHGYGEPLSVDPAHRICSARLSSRRGVPRPRPGLPLHCSHLLLSQRKRGILLLGPKMRERIDVRHGTLSLMVLKTLEVLGPLHGYGIARRIEHISDDQLAVNQGTLYPVLLKLEQEGMIASEWGASGNNRRARFYRLTHSGSRQLQREASSWQQTTAIIARFFEVKAEDLS